jgi:PleD family two-component response regulator
VVLVSSDQEWFARSIDSVLGLQGYAVLRAFSGRQTLDLAASTAPDAVILDTKTRDLDGFEVCRLLRSERRVSASTPVILTAASATTRADRLKAFAAGAWEFYPQPLDGEVLLAQLSVFLSAKHDSDRMRDENLLDGLTGLYSMRGLARRAREIGAEAYRLRIPLACVALTPLTEADDRETSTAVAQNERVVEHVGKILRSVGRVSDAIGRFGHAEFGMVAPATDEAGVLKLVGRLQGAVDANPLSGAVPTSIGFKVGYDAVGNYADSPVDAVEMLLRASSALHAALSDSDSSIRAFG